ncbi:MAG: murein biosynthesis integral membrane protein MurJ [Actinomycetia bacterium]|nr:murein biosynthesis integral membrane protein MurJ [Actinomycetes bacterium]
MAETPDPAQKPVDEADSTQIRLGAANQAPADEALFTQGAMLSDGLVDEEKVADSENKLLRNSALMAIGSTLSRATGLFRDIALAAALGSSLVADAFVLGNQLPDITYVLIIGGALNAIFVPLLVRRMKDDKDGGKAYTDSLLSLVGTVLVVLTVVAVLAAPWLIDLYASPDYSSGQLELAVAFARYCLPQIFFFGLYAMLMQVLNARGHFAAPMFAPIFNNVVAVITYLSFAIVVGSAAVAGGTLTSGQTAWLGIGTTLGIVAQACVLIPVVLRSGYRFTFSWQWRGMGMRKAGRLAGWTLGLVAVTQIGFLVATRLATTANVNAAAVDGTPVGLASYARAYLVFMIPHGIITVSLVTAQLPNLSRKVHAGAMRDAGNDIGHTMRLAAAIVTPIALALVFGALPLAAILFGWGASSAAQAEQIGVLIAIFMTGLIPFTLYYVLQRGWYAMENTRTPFLMAVLLNVAFVALAIPMFNMSGPGGPQVNALAAAYSLANWILFIVAWPTLRRAYGYLDVMATVRALLKVLAAAGLVSGLMIAIRLTVLPPFGTGDSKIDAFWTLIVTAIIVLVSYLLVAWLLRITEIRELLTWARGKLPGRR